jgi:putative lipoprotein
MARSKATCRCRSTTYDPAQVKPGHRYAVSARIELDGKLLFINTEHHGVMLDGSDQQSVRIKVDPVR